MTAQRQPPAVQTDPPSIPVKTWFPDGHFPVGITSTYKDSYKPNASPEDLAKREIPVEQYYEDLRQAAEVHRQVWRHLILVYVGPKVCRQQDQAWHAHGRHL